MKNKLLSSRPDAVVSTDTAILLLRVGAAALILTHGVPKVMSVFAGEMQFGDPIGIGPGPSLVLSAFAEGICGFLILLGLWTRLAAIPLIINMAVAAFIYHAGDPFGNKEKAFLFLLLFIVLFLTGGGKYSLDEKIGGKQQPHEPPSF